MHEMSLAVSILHMAEAEAARAGCSRLATVVVHYGQISGVMPEALALAFDALIADGPHCHARLELEELPLRLRCPFCQTVFSGSGTEARFQPCPECGEEFGHVVEQGAELLLVRVEAAP